MKTLEHFCATSEPERVRNFKKCHEMQLAAYIAKVTTQKSNNPSEPDSVFQVILISSDQLILCVQVHDANYFLKGAFPSEQSKVLVDGLIFD